MSEFAAVLNVSALNGTNGFRLDGDAAYDNSGNSVGDGGDIDGDGFADLLIGAPYSDTGGTNRGLAWVVFGGGTPPAAGGLAARVAAGSAYRFQGELAGDRAGFSVANAGDVNGDGIDDLIIGASYADPDVAAGNRGASYLVFGGTAQLEALDSADGQNDNLISLALLTPATGYRFDGVANYDRSGISVSGAGDVNGDGFADLIIGAPYADPNGGINEGASTIIFGGSNLLDLDDDDGSADARIDLAQVSAGQGLRLDGQTTNAFDNSGMSVAVVGDVNGDGFDDALIGAPGADPNSGVANGNEGAAYLIFGRPQALFSTNSLDLSLLTGLEGTRFDGVAANDYIGFSVNGLGDINGDGLADIVIGAPFADILGTGTGSAYVVFGKSTFGASRDLATLTGADGFRLDGVRAGDAVGRSVSAAGDVNGDGFGDILVGADGFDRLGASATGAAYVVFGKASGFDATMDLGALDGDSGFRIDGAVGGDRLGFTTSAVGDVNGDGFDDIIVSARFADNNSLNYSGSTYVIYGHRADTAVTRVGTAIDNRINGGKDDDTISGLSGDDTLIGWEGDDAMSGGSGLDSLDGGTGNDTLSGGSERDTFIASTGEDEIDGGSGRDVWIFTSLGSQAIILDLASGSFAHPNGEDIQTFTSIQDVTGTNGADTILGTHASNTLRGSGGTDTLDGRNGADILIGGAAQDTLTGGLGADKFQYSLTTDSQASLTARDIITDFTLDPAAGTAFIDRIDLGAIDAMAATTAVDDAFSFINQSVFTAEGQIRAIQSGADTLVEINTSGTSVPEMRILLQNVTATSLSEFDFVL